MPFHRGEHRLDRRNTLRRIRRIEIAADVDVPDVRPLQRARNAVRRERGGYAAPRPRKRVVVKHDPDAIRGAATVALKRRAVAPAPEECLERVVGPLGFSAAAVHMRDEESFGARVRGRFHPSRRAAAGEAGNPDGDNSPHATWFGHHITATLLPCGHQRSTSIMTFMVETRFASI